MILETKSSGKRHNQRREGADYQSLEKKEIQQGEVKKGFRGFWEHLVEIVTDPETAAGKDIAFLTKKAIELEMNFVTIATALTEDRDNTFDITRQAVNYRVSYLLTGSQPRERIGDEKAQEIGRYAYASIIGKLVKKSTSSKDSQLGASYKATAWSILAQDVDQTMVPHGQAALSPEWKSTMGRLINTRQPDMKLIGQELNKFVQRAPGVF